MSLVAAVLWVVGSVLGRLAMRSMEVGDSKWTDLTLGDAIAAASVLLSLLLFAYTRRANRDPRRILDLGLVYMVLTALALGLTFHSGPILPTLSVSPQISWIGAVVLMFSAIVPSTRTRMLLAGLVAVSMNPVGMLWARAQGLWDFGPASNALLMHYPDYLLVGVGVVISHVVTTLGRQVAKAREMGSYQLGELLGRGGMGEVYKASHRMLARPAAIKLIRPEMLGGTDPAVAARAIARFRREAEAAAQLRSAHTVDLYDFGVTEDQTRLSGDGVPGRNGSRVTGSAAWPDAGIACDSCPSPGLRLTRRGARATVWSIEISSLPTFISGGSGATRISSRCSISVS